MRCKDGHIVEDTAMLVTKRGLKCSISANAALEAAEEMNLTYNDNTRTLSFEGLVSTVSSKVESECMRDVEDREIACALYVASSWFSTDGPRADEGKDFVWGNRRIETKDNSEIVQWLPKTMGVLYMAGWRVVPTINVSGEYELYTPTERLWGRSRWLSTEKDRPLEETDWREFRSLAMEKAPRHSTVAVSTLETPSCRSARDSDNHEASPNHAYMYTSSCNNSRFLSSLDSIQN